jgi:FkbM family methyltransferase
MKRLILGTGIGRLALAARDSVNLAVAALTRPEIAGMVSNDYLAGVLITRLCKANKTFIDIGAHIGSVFAGVAYYCPSVRIIAIEPIPEKVVHLRRKFSHVECHACALSDSEGETSFFVNTKRSGFSSLVRPSRFDESEVTEMKVPLKKLDTLISSREVDLIKIDVEGAELGVLRGGERLVAESRPTIMFESVLPTGNGLGYTTESLWQWFAEREYAVLVPNRIAHNDPGLSQDCFVESHMYPRRTANYFAIANERRVEIQDRARDVLKSASLVGDK